MSLNLLGFLTLLEDRVKSLLPADKNWRFQRLVNLRTDEGTLQLWAGDALTGQVELRFSRQAGSHPSVSGVVQSTAATAAPRPFSFRPANLEESERQAQQVAELWRQTLPD